MAASTTDFDGSTFNASNVDLLTADPRDITCALSFSGNNYNGQLGARISSIFVILIVSTAVTVFPVIAKRIPRLRIPLHVYLFSRYFGAGVIVATAWIHLLNPAYAEIGPASCVGMTGAWTVYPWCAALVLSSVMVIFLCELGAERYVEAKYGICNDPDIQEAVTGHRQGRTRRSSVLDDPEAILQEEEVRRPSPTHEKAFVQDSAEESESAAARLAFGQQIAAFLILEFGIIFHSVIIGLNLGVVGDEFSTLYPVLVFHQSFEGLGIGARMSAIPFKKGSWLPWVLCLAYGFTTPIAIAAGLGVRTTYNPNSYTANVVSGVFDSISAGILMYTGLVGLLARDFLFDPDRTRNNKRLIFMVVCVLLGAGIMALLGKWA